MSHIYATFTEQSGITKNRLDKFMKVTHILYRPWKSSSIYRTFSFKCSLN